jgi:hypothetical protein
MTINTSFLHIPLPTINTYQNNMIEIRIFSIIFGYSLITSFYRKSS